MGRKKKIIDDNYRAERWLYFWENVDVSDNPDGCWNWTGYARKSGYGQFWYGGDLPASRAVWIMRYGPLKTEDYICHKCDNPKCVRLEHLYKGTVATNNADKIGKMMGEKSPYHKLKQWQALYIKQSKGFESSQSLADFFEVSQSAVKSVFRGDSWSWLSA